MPSLHQLLRVGVFATLSVLAAPFARAQSQEVELAFQNGATALRDGHNDIAEREFRKAVRLDPSLAEAHLDLGLVLGREGKVPDAIASLNKAIELNPRLDSAHMFLGIFQYQTGHFDEAVAALNQELALHPKNGETLSWLGIVELAAGHPELATAPFDAASALAPNDLTLLEYRGRAHSQVASASYSRMAELSPNSWQVHKVRAELLVGEKKDHEAAAEYEAGLTVEPNNADLYEGLGDAQRRLNDMDAAQKAYAHELQLAPQNPIAMYNLGSTDIDKGDYAAGIPLLEAMLKIYSTSATAEFYLGRGLAESNKDDEAVTWLEKSAAADPNSELAKRSYYELSRIYRKLHRPEDAQRTLTAYNRLRDASEKQSADKLADFKKQNTAK